MKQNKYIEEIATLRQAKAMIEDPDRWCVGRFEDDTGERHCAVGALLASITGKAEMLLWHDDGYEYYNFCRSFLSQAACELYRNLDVPQINDKYGHDAVLKLYDRAIESLFEEGRGDS